MKLINRSHQKISRFLSVHSFITDWHGLVFMKIFWFCFLIIFLYRTYHVYYSYIFRADFTAKLVYLYGVNISFLYYSLSFRSLNYWTSKMISNKTTIKMKLTFLFNCIFMSVVSFYIQLDLYRSMAVCQHFQAQEFSNSQYVEPYIEA